jgi:two-component system, OmpR family, KDP operon response regulator KdpE
MRELNARIQVALRHHQAATSDDQPSQLDAGPLHLDLAGRQATYHGKPVDLTPRELDFLAYLARNAGKVCTRQMILENVWGPGYGTESHYLKVYAYRIRRKLGDEDGLFLQSDPAVGYRLAAPAQ